ncbi:MAG: efflux RND transporter periplasmic adaptor subunit [Candidatus Moraniibacteriota bacterium]|jgi:RND family efflux transporter MFP subunit
MKNKIITVIVVLILVVGGIFFFRSRNIVQSYTEVIIASGDVEKTIDINAQMTPEVYADISTELPTLINSVDVSVNDYVEEGQELFRLDKKSIYAQINNAKLAVERAELAEQQARRKWDVLKPEERESIKKATEQSRQTLNEIYAQAAKTTIVSPIDGVIIEQNARVGEVASGIIMKIIDLESLRVEGLLPEVDVAKVSKGDKAYIVFDAYPNNAIAGTFASMDTGSTVDQNSTYYKTIIDIDNKENIAILDGMNAEVDIVIEHKNNVTIVLRDITQKDDEGYFVYVMNSENNKKDPFVKKYFETGIIGDENIEIISGLSVGDKVVKLENVE